MKPFNVGIQLYGVRESMAADFEGTLRAVRDMGYTHVEFAGYFGKSSAYIRELLATLGLTCSSVHQRPDFFDADPDAACAFLKDFGVRYAVIPWYDVDALVGERREETLAYLQRTADMLRAHGMTLGYHNHEFEFARDGGKTLHEHIFDAIAADRIVPELDTCWVRYAGQSPAAQILKFKGRVPIVHLKDFTGTPGDGPAYELIGKGEDGKTVAAARPSDFAFCPVGYGCQDFASILAACEEAGTETLIVEQDRTYGGMSELEAARLSREYLRSTFSI